MAEPIPQIDWLEIPLKEPKKNLETCINLCHNRNRRDAFDLFLEWLLFGFGDPSVKQLPSQIESKLSAAWYKTFNLGLYLQHPYDYLGEFAAELYGSGRHNPTAYYPTPMSVSLMMARMMMSESDKTTSVCDPCLGSGRLLMAASNYSLNLYGMDIDARIINVSLANFWQYVPWAVCRPNNIDGLDAVQQPDADSLAVRPIVKTTKETQDKLLNGVQLELF